MKDGNNFDDKQQTPTRLTEHLPKGDTGISTVDVEFPDLSTRQLGML